MADPTDTHNSPTVDQTPLQWSALEGRAIESAAGPLLDRCFDVERLGGTHFLDDFPVWKSGVAGTRLIIAKSGPQTVACAGMRSAQLITPNGTLIPVGVIGAVATETAFRGKGLASQIVSTWLSEARKQKLSAVFLWGSEIDLYHRLGFELCGEQVRAPIKAFPALAESVRERSSLQEGYTLGIFQKMLQRREGFSLHARDEAWIRGQRSVRWFTLGDPQAPDAYAAFGRGIDLQNMVHEWGGDPENVKRLLSLLAYQIPEAEVLCSPRHLDAWGLGELTLPREFLGLAQVLDAEPWVRAFGLKPPSAGLSSHELTRQILGPLGSADVSAPGCAPFWVWGLDAA